MAKRKIRLTPLLSFRKEPAPHIPETLNIGRNEPCPCGSGMKFKKCCGDEKRSFLSRWWRLRRIRRILKRKGRR